MNQQNDPEWIDTLCTAERTILDLRSIGMRRALTLGRLHYNQASPPLPQQCHPNWMVLVFLLSGRQTYVVDGRHVSIQGGETLRILPGQSYGTGPMPEQKCDLAWLILNLRPLPRSPALGMSIRGARTVFASLVDPMSPQIRPMAQDAAETLDCIFRWWDRRDDDLGRETIRNRISSLVLGAAAMVRYGDADAGDLANQTRIERVMRWITGRNFEPVDTIAMAEIAGLSPARFHVHFKRVTGSSPKDWLLRQRVERAAQRLRSSPDHSITRVAHEFGFSSSQYFATVFRRYLGTSPGSYRSNENNVVTGRRSNR